MPLQLWVQAARLGLRIKEVGIPRIYLDFNRAFGGALDDAEARLAYYHRVIAAAEADEKFLRRDQGQPCDTYTAPHCCGSPETCR
jgi:dolichol-phosphate mannosyltransferase